MTSKTKMGFTEAIKIVLFQKYGDFSGRARRAEYWWFVLFTFVISYGISWLISSLMDILLFSPFHASLVDISVSLLLGLYLFIPSLSVEVRRLHDRNMSGFWAMAWGSLQILLMLYLAIFVFFLVKYRDLIIDPEQMYSFMAEYVESIVSQQYLMILFFIILAVLWVLLLVGFVVFILLIFKGTNGPNRYGPDPLGLNTVSDVFR
ncbi:DUF805 domain-containing protein [Bartonella sp. HY329]|uniref:DUF805 domain-containing protein n=1 Tax=unclassified Bartonella TaxID=2645622 RepID=UPI0021C6D241|nr:MULTISPECIES: DUF805 domain-containing protein [unclassified Bartonella]UXM95996.1 DUF805 domain-containing protein [Bartonella sp. HY329]UXN10321.1 DUF805 domain-containing protein [Bartonella sp. HY328]